MEEDIDIETLQAQIDLSLAYTQNLVSSWVKPSNKPTKNSTRALIEAEIKDSMRRPPRLGVGAAVPETVASSSRDTERLKARLTGKGNNKRAREEDNEPGSSKQQQRQHSDAEEDSRGASHKKKARLDPFEARNKKKKDKEVVSKPSTPPPRLPVPKNVDKASAIETDVKPEEGGPRTTIPDSAFPLVSPSKRRKKKHKHKISLTESASQAGQSKDSLMDIDAPVNISTTSNLGNDRDSPLPTTEPIDISLITESSPTSPVSPTRDRKHSPLLKGPLLNLTGPPPSGSESDGEDDMEQNATSPKKKRRKRKKKKNSMGAKLGV
ncbi:hypothetical protein R3P38DRAFT_2832142 [Favolaschia claudopus]|uniref:Uncharacterized protein n=1 Tax=Favolaschia claudopus TaxID=2862362 RepID=A0AAW0EE10_9AGAR